MVVKLFFGVGYVFELENEFLFVEKLVGEVCVRLKRLSYNERSVYTVLKCQHIAQNHKQKCNIFH